MKGASTAPFRFQSAGYLFSVAQTASLLYRRLPIGRGSPCVRQIATLQDGILRDGRLAVCATLNKYSADRPCHQFFVPA